MFVTLFKLDLPNLKKFKKISTFFEPKKLYHKKPKKASKINTLRHTRSCFCRKKRYIINTRKGFLCFEKN